MKAQLIIGRWARLTTALVAAAVCIGAFTGHASAGYLVSGPNRIDVDGNGTYDAIVREPNSFSSGNVGAKCWYYTDTNQLRVSSAVVRPPRMSPLYQLASEAVAWRMVLINYNNPQQIWYPKDWIGGTAYRSQPTEFGGGGDTYPFDLSSNDYWAGSQATSWLSTYGQWQPAVQVAWLNPWTNTWIIRNLIVQYAFVFGTLAYPLC
jgi:hypothetical protein